MTRRSSRQSLGQTDKESSTVEADEETGKLGLITWTAIRMQSRDHRIYRLVIEIVEIPPSPPCPRCVAQAILAGVR